MTESYFHLEADHASSSNPPTTGSLASSADITNSAGRPRHHKMRRQSTFVQSGARPGSAMSFAPLDTSTPRRICLALAPSQTSFHSQIERAISRVHVENLIPYSKELLKFVTLDPSRRLSRWAHGDVYAGLDRVDKNAMRCVFVMKLSRREEVCTIHSPFSSSDRSNNAEKKPRPQRMADSRPASHITRAELPRADFRCVRRRRGCVRRHGMPFPRHHRSTALSLTQAIRPAHQQHPALSLQGLFRENDMLREQCDRQIVRCPFSVQLWKDRRLMMHGRRKLCSSYTTTTSTTGASQRTPSSSSHTPTPGRSLSISRTFRMRRGVGRGGRIWRCMTLMIWIIFCSVVRSR